MFSCTGYSERQAVETTLAKRRTFTNATMKLMITLPSHGVFAWSVAGNWHIKRHRTRKIKARWDTTFDTCNQRKNAIKAPFNAVVLKGFAVKNQGPRKKKQSAFF